MENLNFKLNPEPKTTGDQFFISTEKTNELIDIYGKRLNSEKDRDFISPIKEMVDAKEVVNLEELMLVTLYAGFKQAKQSTLDQLLSEIIG